MSESSRRIRIEWKAGDAKRDAGLSAPEDVEAVYDISYEKDPVWNLLDVYRPAGKKEKLPVIVSVHGGGWVYGDKNLYRFYGMSLAQRGFAVVNFSYRLAPEAKFPAQLEDTNSVIEWVFQNADEYGLDLEHIYMLGDSAGGHLLGLYMAVCTDEAYAARYPFRTPAGFIPRAIAVNCGVCDPLTEETVIGEKEDIDLMQDLLPEGGSEAEKEILNVTDHINDRFPPAYLMTAVGDYCKPQVLRLWNAMKEKGVCCECRVYGEESNPLYHIFHVTMQEPLGQQCNDDECAFFKKWR